MELFTYSDGARLRKLFNAVAVINNDDPLMQFSQSGLLVEELSRDHTRLIRLEIPSSDFDQYSVETPVSFHMPLEKVVGRSGVLKMAKKGDPVIFNVEYHNDLLDTLIIKIKRSKFTIPIPTLYRSDLPDVNIPVNAMVILDLAEFEESLKMFKVVEDTIIDFNIESGVFTLTSRDESATCDVVFESGDDAVLDIDGCAKSSFDLELLMPLVKALKPLCDVVSLLFGNDAPVELIATGHKLCYYLAPCIK